MHRTEHSTFRSVDSNPHQNGAKVDTLEGANALQLTNKVEQLSKSAPAVTPAPHPQQPTSSTSTAADATVDLNERLTQLVNTAPAMLFMKGSPAQPQCGFSSKIVDLLNKQNVKFSSFNILADPIVRDGLKKFSNWPTYPQLYLNGKLVGGLDIVKELIEEGEFQDMVPPEARVA